MIKLRTFTGNNETLLKFVFSSAEVKADKWITITSEKQKIHFHNQLFTLYDDDIPHFRAHTEDFFLTTSWIQDAYKDKQQILLISNLNQEPLMLFYGNQITFKHYDKDIKYTALEIDGKEIHLSQCAWMILTRNIPL